MAALVPEREPVQVLELVAQLVVLMARMMHLHWQKNNACEQRWCSLVPCWLHRQLSSQPSCPV